MFKYKQDIFDTIIKSLLENDVDNEGLTYSNLYKLLAKNLRRKLSYRDYGSHIENMMTEGIIYSQKVQGKKKSKYLCLTENAKKQYQLKILGVGEEYEKRLSLYHLLIYFEAFKRGQILDDKELDRLLKKIGSSRERLNKIDTSQFNVPLLNFELAYEEPIQEIEIMQLPSNRLENKPVKKIYYVLMLGFSRKEFISYIKKLRNGREPRPFSRSPALVPFVHFVNYTPMEVDDAISLLEKAGLLRPITFTVKNEERRFRIADKNLIKMIQDLHFIQKIYYHKIVMKIAFLDKPDEEEKDFLIYHFGKEIAGHVIAFLSDNRRKYIKKLTEREALEKKQIVLELCYLVEDLLLSCKEENKELLNDEFLKDLYLPFSIYEEK